MLINSIDHGHVCLLSTHDPKRLVLQIVHEGRKVAGIKLDMGVPNRVSALTLLKIYP